MVEYYKQWWKKQIFDYSQVDDQIIHHDICNKIIKLIKTKT